MSTGVVLTVLSLLVGVANASGESVSATLTSPTSGTATTFTWSYVFNQNGGHGLSNIAIRFCDSSLLDHVVSAGPNATVQPGGVTGGHTGFGGGIRFDTQDPSGTLTVTFDQGYAIAPDSVNIQSHSGDGQDGDPITEAAGPAGAPCPSDPTTTTTVVDDPTTTTTLVENPTTTTTLVENPTTTTTLVENPTTTTTLVENPTTTTTLVENPTTTTLVENPTTTTLVEDPSTTTTVKVLGATFTATGVAGDVLARTGSDVRAQLALAGLALSLGGFAVVFGERRNRGLVD